MKNKKSLVALVVMAFMLVASITMAATGAWFTDNATGTSSKITFGTVAFSSDAATVTTTIKNLYANTTDLVMPGSEITVSCDLTYEGTASAWVRYKLSCSNTNVTLAGTGSEDGYYYVATKMEKGSTVVSDITATVSKALTNASIEGTEVTFTLQIEAIQAANTAATNGADAFTAPTV